MTCVLAIGSDSDAANVLGTRYSAIDFRERIERQLESCPSVELNFTGVFVTQSFVDELLGPLILRMGPTALERLVFVTTPRARSRELQCQLIASTTLCPSPRSNLRQRRRQPIPRRTD